LTQIALRLEVGVAAPAANSTPRGNLSLDEPGRSLREGFAIIWIKNIFYRRSEDVVTDPNM
jgi:hypothetical protein